MRLYTGMVMTGFFHQVPKMFCSVLLQNIFHKMYSAQKTDKEYGDYVCSGFVYDYIIAFHHCMDNKLNKIRKERSNLLLPVLNYIDENFHTDFPLTHLAELAGITPMEYRKRVGVK